MIQVTAQTRILVAVEAVDFRRGIDGLARVCRDYLNLDPFSGVVFVFRNRRGTSIKLLTYDGQGYWCMQKRLSTGRFLASKCNRLVETVGGPPTAGAFIGGKP